jgi:hypothetical protein
MQRTINETDAKQISLECVKAKESGAQAEIKSVEQHDMRVAQTKETNGIQYADVTVSGTGEVEDYKWPTFHSVSTSQRIKSKLRSIFARGNQEEIYRAYFGAASKKRARVMRKEVKKMTMSYYQYPNQYYCYQPPTQCYQPPIEMRSYQPPAQYYQPPAEYYYQPPTQYYYYQPPTQYYYYQPPTQYYSYQPQAFRVQ